MRIAIVGSTKFEDLELAKKKFYFYFGSLFNDETGIWEIDHIVSGGAKGADTLAKKIAKMEGIKLIEHLPDWDKYGKPAGPIRNKLIIDDCDVVLAFWTGISKHSGTANDIKLARAAKKETIIVYI
jgi:hypothetical protein